VSYGVRRRASAWRRFSFPMLFSEAIEMTLSISKERRSGQRARRGQKPARGVRPGIQSSGTPAAFGKCDRGAENERRNNMNTHPILTLADI